MKATLIGGYRDGEQVYMPEDTPFVMVPRQLIPMSIDRALWDPTALGFILYKRINLEDGRVLFVHPDMIHIYEKP